MVSNLKFIFIEGILIFSTHTDTCHLDYILDVRGVAAKCLPRLLSCVKGRVTQIHGVFTAHFIVGDEEVYSLWEIICDPLLEAICNQCDNEVLIVMMESLCKVCTHIISCYQDSQ